MYKINVSTLNRIKNTIRDLQSRLMSEIGEDIYTSHEYMNAHKLLDALEREYNSDTFEEVEDASPNR